VAVAAWVEPAVVAVGAAADVVGAVAAGWAAEADKAVRAWAAVEIAAVWGAAVLECS
jgi:hypothetical protein